MPDSTKPSTDDLHDLIMEHCNELSIFFCCYSFIGDAVCALAHSEESFNEKSADGLSRVNWIMKNELFKTLKRAQKIHEISTRIFESSTLKNTNHSGEKEHEPDRNR